MKTNETILREIYNIGNKEVKEKMEKEYPSLFTKTTLLDKAIEYLTEQDEEVIKLRKFQSILSEDDNILAEQKLIVIFKHKNEKYIFNWDDSNEYKYYIWWKMKNEFSYSSWYYYCAFSNVPARLCLKNKKLIEELTKEQEIINYFKIYMRQ